MEAPATAPPKAATPAAPPGNFEAAWSGVRDWLRGFDLATRAGRERVRPDELQKRAAGLQQALLGDPEGYLRILRAPENDDLSKFLLSLLCRVVSLEGGHGLLPVSQLPKPILEGLSELLGSGTPNQKLGILHLARRDRWTGQKSLIGDQALVERCGALLSDSDPLVRATAVQALQEVAPKREDPRVEVLEELWRNSTDPTLRSMCLQSLASMEKPAARELLLKGIQQIAADGSWSKDGALMYSSLQAVQTRIQALRPDEEEAYAAVCSTALRGVSEPRCYQGWMEVSLLLPLVRATPLLEQVQNFAPTPELQASARRVLERIRAGETRFDQLQATLRGKR
jgi:hypothetical protein